MRYCSNCGRAVSKKAVVCPGCGCRVPRDGNPAAAGKDDGWSIAIKVFLILGCILQAWMLIPLAWCLPITISVVGKIGRGEPIGTGLKVCALLLVNLIAGSLLLCRPDAE